MTILMIIAAIIAIPLIVALFTRKDYRIEKEVIISRPKQDVFNYIKMLRNQNNYSKWVMMDPNAKMEYTGTDGTPGFAMAWDSENKNVGKGIQTITGIKEGERMDLKVQFIKPFAGLADAYIATDAVSLEQTKVTWAFSSRMNYPMNIMLLVMNMDKMVGNDLSTGLGNLKKVLEK